MPRGRRLRQNVDIWPGFVDAMATLLMVLIFVLLVFVLAQFFMGNALTGRDQALSRLQAEMASMVEQLSLERAKSADVKADLTRLQEKLQASLAERDNLLSSLDEERHLSETARSQADLLNQQMTAMREQLEKLAAALDATEKLSVEQKAQIADLGKRLNVALAGKVEELQRYRSEFFGKLRKVLGERQGIRIEGDRFVFQSELLFDSASADLGVSGEQQVRQLAKTLIDLSKQIPKEVNWVLRVDGHTDKRPIKSGRFPSNWELSTARAISVIRTLIDAGVPADRLAAAGFGEFLPLDNSDSEAALAKNRRIEIRFDQR
ncbi:peptidoglycan -binding protein [Magnetospirillum gryphiswaldense]|uniref:Flagellar motor protein MotB n=1 Tax=Magnetospirillum gryphiswaldense TaxID=55518 RepID=A4TX73_9PROT|nr:peptidoglycan -binding protein [Magnetospirillum gryphiswaldense]AVM74446.1 Motility protein B [Magnetospirillum gryphiswaldense MSR-1]AVM78349.1 Motility protein B [Magnetospirillum gryphiswaldense]CAM75230.1 flagellar motor protein MotB [Magnetospirillum gryphiswaldense MSR-1]